MPITELQAMTPQLIPVLLSPLFLALNLYALWLGFRGKTGYHIAVRASGAIGTVAFVVALVAMLDQITQVWVRRPDSISGWVYVGSGVVFFCCAIASLAFMIKDKSRRRSK